MHVDFFFFFAKGQQNLTRYEKHVIQYGNSIDCTYEKIKQKTNNK